MNRSEEQAWRVLKGEGLDAEITEIVDNLIVYITSYKEHDSLHQIYATKMLIDDMLYGLGLAINKEYRFRDGFSKFKKRLLEHLQDSE